MGSLFQRGARWFVSYKDAAGKWRQASAGTTDEREATKVLEALEAQLDTQRASGDTGPVTVRTYARTWLDRRRQKHEATRKRYEATGVGKVEHRDWSTDESRMRTHVLSSPLGAMKIASVRPKHLADFVHHLRTATGLSSHTIANVYGLLVSMFQSAAVAGLVEATPCVLKRADLGTDDQESEGAGRYSREQFEAMIGAPALPEHARMFAALGGLGGLRLGAIAGLRWRDLDTTAAPLWKLTSARTYEARPTKTGKPSLVPVHPVLAAMLTTWRTSGWAATFGRAPEPDDPIVPAVLTTRTRAIRAHSKKTGGDQMDSILATLEIPAAPMKSHALRSTFISIALEDGARDDLIEKITHTAGKGRRAFDRYDRADYWPQLCAEVVKIRVTGPAALWTPFGGSSEAVETVTENGGGAGSRTRVRECV